MTAPSDDRHDVEAVLDVLLETLALKDESRTGWQLRGVSDPESVAAHSWGVAYLVLALGDRFREDLPGLDLDRALRLAVVHDVAEAVTGDVPTRADPAADTVDDATEEAAERAAIDDLTGPLPDRLLDAWEEYEDRSSPEAVLVKELDLLEMCVQAVYYERTDRYDPGAGEADAFRAYDALDEFFATAESRLRTDTGRRLFDRIRRRYERTRGAER